MDNNGELLEYSYDQNGNITSVSKNGTVVESYTYDALGQLVTVTRGNDVYGYAYDAAGNILSVTKNGTTYKSYGYTDSEWKDLLTSFCGEAITYDAIGNPLHYRDGISMTWESGRQLSTLTKSGLSASFAYGADGYRTEKTVNGVTTRYYYVGDRLQYQQTGNDILVFVYDDKGTPFGMFTVINGFAKYYFYVYNAQGDVIALIDDYAERVVNYEYGAWGETISITGPEASGIGVINPLRYRGYYYDTETGFYYLNSRYYDPVTQRFVNGDGELAGIGESVRGHNLFAYCFNNPVNMDDQSGQWPKWIGKAIAVVVVAVVVTVSTFGAGSVAGVAAISAAVTIAARATEVAILQAKKSKSSSQNAGGKPSGSTSYNNENSPGGGESNPQKSNGQVAVDVIESIFDNGLQIIGITPFTKAGSIGFNHILNQQVSKVFGETTTLKCTLSASCGKVVSYAFAAYAWCNTTISIFSDDPVKRAEQRGYTLK